jgi:hypothetical protein
MSVVIAAVGLDFDASRAEQLANGGEHRGDRKREDRQYARSAPHPRTHRLSIARFLEELPTHVRKLPARAGMLAKLVVEGWFQRRVTGSWSGGRRGRSDLRVVVSRLDPVRAV